MQAGNSGIHCCHPSRPINENTVLIQNYTVFGTLAHDQGTNLFGGLYFTFPMSPKITTRCSDLCPG
jgi:hypothetical protein